VPDKTTAVEWVRNHRGEKTFRTDMVKMCMRATGVPRAVAREAVNEVMGPTKRSVTTRGLPKKADTPQRRKPGTMTRESFLTTYDHDTRTRQAIREAVGVLGDDDIVALNDFRSDWCGGRPSNGFRQIALEDEFSDYRFAKGDKIFFCTPATKMWALESVSGTREA